MPRPSMAPLLRRLRFWLLIWLPGALVWGVLLASLPNDSGRWEHTWGAPTIASPLLGSVAALGQGIPPQNRRLSYLGVRFLLQEAKTRSTAEIRLLRGTVPPRDSNEMRRRTVARRLVLHKDVRQDLFFRFNLAPFIPDAQEGLYVVVRLAEREGQTQLRLWMAQSADWNGPSVQVLEARPGGRLAARSLHAHLVLEMGNPGQRTSLVRSLVAAPWGIAALLLLLACSVALVVLLAPRPEALFVHLVKTRRALREQAAARSWRREGLWLPALLCMLCIFGVLLYRVSWVTDDAFLTLRTVYNYIQGHGLTWNIDERVQVFTHPLWLIILTGGFLLFDNAYLTALCSCLAATVLAVLLLSFRIAHGLRAAILAVALLALSRAFMDFSTSGLENPLTHLLLILFALLFLRSREVQTEGTFLLMWLLSGLLLLTRMDVSLLIAPPLAVATVWHTRALKMPRRDLVRLALLGLGPFVLWELFSLFYYGFPLPNTAYAKLWTGIPRWALVKQGLMYLLNSVDWDPVTLTVILTSVSVPLLTRDRRLWVLLAGALLYLMYVVWIGGCFMSGRFLAAPFLVAVVVWARLPLARIQLAVLPLLALLTLSISTRFEPPPAGPNYRLLRMTPAGIADERIFYYERMLRFVLMGHDMLDVPYAPARRSYVRLSCGGSGILGFVAGDRLHIVDPCGLGDALLARLPAEGALTTTWRIGHFERRIPVGYGQAVVGGQNLLPHTDLVSFLDRLRTLITWDLLDPARLGVMVRMNLGRERHVSSVFATVKVKLAQVSRGTADRAPADAPGHILMQGGGVDILLGELRFNKSLELSLAAGGRYQLIVLRRGFRLMSTWLGSVGGSGMRTHTVKIPQPVSNRGFDTIRVFPVKGKGWLSLGHLRLH